MNLSKDILAHIKKEQLTPRPRWHFVARNVALWIAAIAGVVLASLGLGSLLSDLLMAEWGLSSRFPGGGFGLLRQAVGVLFVAALVAGLAAAVVFVRSTRRGYRYGLTALLAIVLGTALVAGASLVPTGIPKHLRDLHDRHLPPGISAAEMHAPTAGRLLGTLTTDEAGTVYLTAVSGEVYEIWLLGDIAELPTGLTQVFGEEIDDTIFAALQLLPVPDHFKVKELPETLRITR